MRDPVIVLISRIVVVLWVGCFSTGLPAQVFNPETLLSAGNGFASEPALALDFVGNTYVVWVENEEVRFAAGVQPRGADFEIGGGGLTHLHPDIAVDHVGVATVIFEREDSGGKVFYVSNPGGTFGSPINLSQNDLPDHKPRISISSPFVERNAVWVRETPGFGSVVRFSQNFTTSIEVGLGDTASLASHSDGTVHLLYERDAMLFYRHWDYAAFPPLGPEVPVSDGGAPVDESAIAVNAEGAPRIVFAQGGEILYARGDGEGGFITPANLTAGGSARKPQIAVGPTGVLQVVYEEDGDLWRTSGMGAAFATPVQITKTPEIETCARIAVGVFGYLHVAFLRGDDVYYLNEVPPPVASFEIDTPVGEIPLPVQFTNTSEGVTTTRHWDFGDGNSSGAANPAHVYEEIGTFEVTLTVHGPGGTDRTSARVEVLPPSNILRIPDITVFQGEPNVWLPVLATHTDPLQGFQVGLGWDCAFFDVTDVTLDSTEMTVLNPEFFAPMVIDDGEDCHLTVGVVIDSGHPFDGRTLEPGAEQRILNVVLTVRQNAPAPATTEVDLAHAFGDPLIFNIFTVEGISVVPYLVDGTMSVIPFEIPPPALFVRGDPDHNGVVNLPDGLYILAFIFTSGLPPVCMDAADFDDDGFINLSDALDVLNFLFVNGSFPIYPYPAPGLDPSPDTLEDC